MNNLDLILTVFLGIVAFLANSLWIFGFYAACSVETEIDSTGTVHITDEGSKMILWRVKYYSLKWFGEYWSKPIATCPICMASYHSVPLWLFIYVTHFSWILFPLHLVYITCLAGLNKIILYFENL